MLGFKTKSEPAPGIKVMLELWPKQFKGRATIERDGKPQMLEISAPYVALVVKFLRAMGIEL